MKRLTTRQLAKRWGSRLRTAQKAAYTLYKAGFIERVGKKGKAYLYTLG